MSGELEKIVEQAIMTYVKALSGLFLGGTKNNYASIVINLTKMQTRNFPNLTLKNYHLG
jgi:hypothetical protein